MIDYLDNKLKVSKQIEISSDSVDFNKSFLSQAFRVFSQRQRSTVAHTLVKGEVRGSNKKPWRQKGTGRARVGNKRNPVWRSGGIAFGPRNSKSFDLKLNLKQRKSSLLTALSQMQCYVVDNLDSFKAKDFKLPINSNFIAVADNSLLNIRNLSNLKRVCSSKNLSLADLESVNVIVIDSLAFEKLKTRLNFEETKSGSEKKLDKSAEKAEKKTSNTTGSKK